MTHSSWGPGWPSCQFAKINSGFAVATKWGIVKFPGGVRHEITELVARLVKETANRGYRFGTPSDPSYGCWGFACRAIRGSTSPSNHSWGLAVDINAPKNPMGETLITDMPGWMPDLWNAYGFRWGGDYRSRPDAMHYEFIGSLAEAVSYTQIARRNRLGENRTAPPPMPPQETWKDDKMYFLVKGSTKPEWWLTDGMTKRHMKSRAESDHWIWVITAAGGKVDRAPNNQPKVWDQAFVDNVERSDGALDKETDAILKYYAAHEEGPVHEIVRQVLAEQ